MKNYKERYKTDSEFRERERARNLEYYHRTKKLIGEKTGPKVRSPEERFWSNVVRGPNENDCWDWKGASRNRSSHASLSVDGTTKAAYRYSWELHYGPLTSEQYVRLKCRNKLCTNPKHLYLGDLSSIRPEKILEMDEREAFERSYKASKRAKLHYEKNRDRARKGITRLQLERKLKAIAYLGGNCPCGENHPSALQFHHRDPKEKSFGITTKELAAPRKYPWEVIQRELNKCDLTCANCRFKKHAFLSEAEIEEIRKLMLC